MQSIKDHERVIPASEQRNLVNDLAGAWRGRLIDDAGRAESFNLHRDDADHRLPGQFHLFTTPDGLVAGRGCWRRAIAPAWCWWGRTSIPPRR